MDFNTNATTGAYKHFVDTKLPKLQLESAYRPHKSRKVCAESKCACDSAKWRCEEHDRYECDKCVCPLTKHFSVVKQRKGGDQPKKVDGKMIKQTIDFIWYSKKHFT